MPSINRVTLAGHLGKDPELKTFSNGGKVCNFSIATSEKWVKDDRPQERTDWHNIVCNDKTAEIAHTYLRKGAAVLIEGSIRYRQYEKDGQKRTATEIRCDRLHFLGKSEKSSQEPAQEATEPSGGGGPSDDIPFRARSWKEG